MTQIINKPKDTVSHVLNGVAFIHQDKLERIKNTGIITYKKRLPHNETTFLCLAAEQGFEP